MKLNFFNCSEMNARQTEIKKSNSLQNKFLPINDFFAWIKHLCSAMLNQQNIILSLELNYVAAEL